MEQAGGFECIGFCEIDRHAAAAYRAIYETEKEVYYDDVTRIDTAGMPDFDLFVGGFPCQPYSAASSNPRGFADPRGALFFDLARIIKDKRPAVFLLENVPTLLRHQSGKTYGTILYTLLILPKRGKGSILSDIAVRNAPAKYSLSSAAIAKVLSRSSADRKGRESIPPRERR